MPRQALWKPFILVASYVFYAAADPRFCLLLGGITVGNQIAAVLIARDRRRAPAQRGSAPPPSPSTCSRSASSSTTRFFVTDVGDVLDSIALGMPLPLLTIALPIGVSFFTFQAITYVVDVKRGDAEPASLVDAGDLPELLPPPGRRADRPRERVPAPAQGRRATRAGSRSAPASC